MKIFCFRVHLVGEKSGRRRGKQLVKDFDIYSRLKRKMNKKITGGTQNPSKYSILIHRKL